MKKLITILFGIGITSTVALADANYYLTCNMNGNVATVYICNSGDSSEGNNEYVYVTACTGSRCDTERELMYIYGPAGRCKEAESITFSREYDYCSARF